MIKKLLSAIFIICIFFCFCACGNVSNEEKAKHADELILLTRSFDQAAITIALEAYNDLPQKAKVLVKNKLFLDFVEKTEIRVYRIFYLQSVPEVFVEKYYLPKSKSAIYSDFNFITFDSSDDEVIIDAFAKGYPILIAARRIFIGSVNQNQHVYTYDGVTLNITPKWIATSDIIFYGYIVVAFIVKMPFPVEITYPEIPDNIFDVEVIPL